MGVQIVQLILEGSPSSINKQLLEFIKRNLRDIITRGQVRLKFKVAKPSDTPKLKARGVKKLPAMLLPGGKSCEGRVEIAQWLISTVKNSRQVAAPKSDEEVLRDYYTSELTKGRDENGAFNDADDDDDGLPDLSGALQKELERRGTSKMPGSEYMTPKASREAPPKPSHDVDFDDFEDRGAQRPNVTVTPRRENIKPPQGAEVGDALAALSRIPGKNKQDDMDHGI
jgi:hypothetical protein